MLIFLYGEDSFRSHEKLLEIKQKYLDKDKSGSGLSFCDAESEKNILQRIKNNFETNNLFATKRLLIVKDILAYVSETEQEKILEYFKKNKKIIFENSDTVAIFWESNLPKKNKLFSYLKNGAKAQNFEKLSGAKLSAWTLKTLEKLDPKAKISPLALQKITSFAPDTSLLFFELNKLANYTDGRVINEKDIDDLVKANFSSNIFTTIDALGANNKREALKQIHAHLEKGDDPFYLLSMIAYQFRTMLKIADLAKNTENINEISRLTKLHPFVVRKNLAQIKYFSLDKLKKIYQKLANFDFLLKTGKLEVKLALDKLVAEL